MLSVAVLEHGLRRLMRVGPLLSGRLLAGAAEDRRDNHQQRRAEVEHWLQVLLEHALGLWSLRRNSGSSGTGSENWQSSPA